MILIEQQGHPNPSPKPPTLLSMMHKLLLPDLKDINRNPHKPTTDIQHNPFTLLPVRLDLLHLRALEKVLQLVFVFHVPDQAHASEVQYRNEIQKGIFAEQTAYGPVVVAFTRQGTILDVGWPAHLEDLL